MPASPQLPIEVLPAWARLNSVKFTNVELGHIDGRGLGLVATQDYSLSTDDEDLSNSVPLLKVPRELVLSAGAVEEYAKVDHNFQQLLDTAEPQSSREAIVLFLLAHLVPPNRDEPGAKAVVLTPWTEYIKFLPRQIPVPTLWTAHEISLLQGTSLESAVHAKLTALNNEFDELREKSSGLPFWNSFLWMKGTATLEDWALADAWYRSRCLELPCSGDGMVPSVDMANHSHEPNAYYEEDSDGDVELLVRPGCKASRGEEVTISYGEFKSAAEMLFSYGFIDGNASRDKMAMPLDSFPDDPLATAKLHIFGGLPTVRLSRERGTVKWESAFLHLMCLNEEDGLEFRVLQDQSGARELKLFWQEQDVTSQAAEFESLTEAHPLCPLFRLRSVTALSQQINTQLERLRSPEKCDLTSSPEMRAECVRAAETLGEIESSLLEDAVTALEDEQSNLLGDEQVKAYLGLTEDAKNDQASASVTNDEDDFS